MRIYSLILAISITCGGGKGGEDASATSDGSTGEDPSGVASSGSEASTPTTGEDPQGTGTSDDPGVTTGPATSLTSTTLDPSESTGGDEETGGDSSSEGSSESTGPGAPENATVDDSCAPNDGAALEFRVGLDEASCGAPWSGDQLRLLVYLGAPLTPGVYPLDGGAGAAVFDGGDGLVFGTVGSLTIESWSDDAVVGSYEVTLEDRSMHSGSFVGPHCLTMPMCG